MIDIVCIACRRDVSLLRLQARSIAKYFRRDRLAKVVYVWNDVEALPGESIEEIGEALDGIEHQIIYARELGISLERIAEDGWTSQQALKLISHRLVSAKSYVVLDSKNHFVRPASVDDFVAENGRGVMPFADLGRDEAFLYCVKYFGAVLQGRELRSARNVTPFVLETDIVARLLATLRMKEGCEIVDVFFNHHHKLTEFHAYQAYCLSEEGCIDLLFQETTHLRDTVIWGVSCINDEEFRRLSGLLENQDAKTLGVHWMACCVLTVAQRAQLIDFWLRRGLLVSRSEGHEILDSVNASLPVGDRQYLRDFLVSCKHV